MNLTFDEQQLMAIFNTGTREGTIAALEKMSAELKADETELLELTDTALEKLAAMIDTEFNELELTPESFKEC